MVACNQWYGYGEWLTTIVIKLEIPEMWKIDIYNFDNYINAPYLDKATCSVL